MPPAKSKEKNYAATQGRNARETAYRIIRDKIIGLELKPGENLNDKVLAEELEMSRTPVHEALILLSTADLVVLKPQTGTFVAPIDVEKMEIEQFIRFALEKEVISRACERKMTDEIRWRYEENLRSYRHYDRSNSKERPQMLLRLDNEFHQNAFLATGQGQSFEVMFARLQHIERMRMLSIWVKGQGINTEDHQEIYEAIAAQDRERALRRLEIHLNHFREDLKLVQDRYPEFFSLGA
jgi:DNA-binding GntR family transcriptional regulator